MPIIIIIIIIILDSCILALMTVRCDILGAPQLLPGLSMAAIMAFQGIYPVGQ